MTASGVRAGAVDPMAVAERILSLAQARAAGAEIEVNVRNGTEALTRFANSFIHQNVAEEISHIGLRIALDGRVAAAGLDGPPDEAALGRLVDGVLEAARVSPIDPDWPGLAPRAVAPTVDHWDEATAGATPEDRAERVADFVAAAGGLETAGTCATAALHNAFANSAGQRLTGRRTSAEITGIARTPTADGGARSASVGIGAIDGRAAGERAGDKARDASDPTDLEPGQYEVVLEPSCVADVLTFLFVHGFNGRAVEDGSSFAKIGELQFDRAINLRDDVTDPETSGVGFDWEGTPRLPVEIVRAGVTSALLHTRRTAAKAGPGTTSTGHAVEGGGAWGALGGNLGLPAGDRSPEALIGGVGRGLLVTDFHYTRILDPRTQVVTGLTRNGAWLIEDGRIVRPVTNLRFTQSYLEALAPGAVRGIGSDRSLVFGDWGLIFLVPSLHLGAWNFTGGARG